MTSLELPIESRIAVDANGCWIWQGSIGDTGYGNMAVCSGDHRITVLVHRLVYQLFIGGVPHDRTLDHLCRNRACCNPSHLEPVSLRENILRATGPIPDRARQTHCTHGHEFTPENTRIKKNGTRCCRECDRIREASRPRRSRASARAETLKSFLDAHPRWAPMLAHDIPEALQR